MALTFSSTVIKYLLFIFNLLFVLTGVVILTVGLTIKGYYNEYNSFLDNKYIYASDLLITIGAIIFIVAFFGCCGAVKENACMTLTFSSLLIAIFILELVVGIGGNLLKNRTDEYLEDKLAQTMQEYNNTNTSEITHLWDTVQRKFICCGVNSPNDWLNTTINHSGLIPLSCCEILDGTVGFASCNINSTTLHTKGCLTAFGDFIRGHAVTIEAVGIGLSIAQLLGIIFACYLSRQIRRDYETV